MRAWSIIGALILMIAVAFVMATCAYVDEPVEPAPDEETTAPVHPANGGVQPERTAEKTVEETTDLIVPKERTVEETTLPESGGLLQERN